MKREIKFTQIWTRLQISFVELKQMMDAFREVYSYHKQFDYVINHVQFEHCYELDNDAFEKVEYEMNASLSDSLVVALEDLVELVDDVEIEEIQ